MIAERWRQVEEIVCAALELDADARESFCADACAGDETLKVEVASLLDVENKARTFIEHPVSGSLARLVISNKTKREAGGRIGAYLIVREIGHGGMGAVFEAVRDDGEFNQRVAIKLIRSDFDTAEMRRHFRHERQILAALDHPNIAKLLDGGTTEDGRPFLVMDYIEGTPITRYCEEHELSLEARLELFRTVCAAVQFAHQNLVIHRDLKPSNILVMSKGAPKLLDFGIAKLLKPTTENDGDEATQTVTMLGVMTPEYASPEQVKGETVTTATDVYSLGVLLYELLSGHRPYRFTSRRPDEIARVICESEPNKPSETPSPKSEDSSKFQVPSSKLNSDAAFNNQHTTLSNRQSAIKNRKSLRGDLDNIVLMAMRKEPSRRYASVSHLSEDIHRYLVGLPVIARKDTFKYRSTKFVKRHKVGVTLASFITLAILSSFILTIWQSRVAQSERARAERRFNDVRQLAHSNLFELHDAIQKLPGSTPARELLTKRSVEYLDNLAQEAGDDLSLQREMIMAYLKVGSVLGNPNDDNLGDTAGAMRSYSKALAIAERLVAANPADDKARRSIAVILEKMGDVQAVSGDVAGGVASTQKSLAIFKAIAESNPTDVEARQSLAISYLKVGDILGNPNFTNFGDRAGAMQNYRLSAEIWTSLYASDQTNPKIRRFLGVSYERIGTMQESEGIINDSLDAYRKSQVIRESLVSDYPTDTEIVRDAAIAHEKIGNILTIKGELKDALESRHKSLEIFENLAKADPLNILARQSLAISYYHLGDLLGNPEFPNLGRRTEALKNYQLALKVLESAKGTDATANVKTNLILNDIHQRMNVVRECFGKVCK